MHFSNDRSKIKQFGQTDLIRDASYRNAKGRKHSCKIKSMNFPRCFFLLYNLELSAAGLAFPLVSRNGIKEGGTSEAGFPPGFLAGSDLFQSPYTTGEEVAVYVMAVEFRHIAATINRTASH